MISIKRWLTKGKTGLACIDHTFVRSVKMFLPLSKAYLTLGSSHITKARKLRPFSSLQRLVATILQRCRRSGTHGVSFQSDHDSLKQNRRNQRKSRHDSYQKLRSMTSDSDCL